MEADEMRTLFTESVPAAGILLFWGGLGALLPLSVASSGARVAGLLIGLLYVSLRGIDLAGSISASPTSKDEFEVLHENATLAAVTGLWFVLAVCVWFFLSPLTTIDTTDGLYASILHDGAILLTTLGTYVFVGTGVLTVVLYVIVVGLPRFRTS